MGIDIGVLPSEAKAIWDQMAEPTCGAVARLLCEAGHKIDRSTIWLWKKNGWRTHAQRVSDENVERMFEEHEAATKKALAAGLPAPPPLDRAIAVLTKNGRGSLDNLARDPDGAERRDALLKMSDHQLLSESAKSALVADAIITWEIARQARVLVKKRPQELGVLIRSVGDHRDSALAQYDRAIQLTERSMKKGEQEVLDPEGTPVNENDPLLDVMAEFGLAARTAAADA